jgi:UDP-N-acetylglucosamine 2-epimerase (non-hydrolysing)
MVDTLLHLLDRARDRRASEALGMNGDRYAFVTLHRPGNVDDPATLRELLLALDDLAGRMPVVFPIHPRTRARVEEFGLSGLTARVKLLDPLPYLDAISLVHGAALVLTDSGGLQEETTVLGVPCLTARPNTERPITVEQGTNRLVASSRAAIGEAVGSVLAGAPGIRARRPEGWDGRAAERVIAAVLSR